MYFCWKTRVNEPFENDIYSHSCDNDFFRSDFESKIFPMINKFLNLMASVGFVFLSVVAALQ